MFSRSGEATAYTTALLPRLASGKASTLLARRLIKSFSLGPKASVKAKDLIQLKSRISAALNMRLRLGDHIVPKKLFLCIERSPRYTDRIDVHG